MWANATQGSYLELHVPNLLALPGGRPIQSMHNLMQSFGRMYQVTISSAMLVRKLVPPA